MNDIWASWVSDKTVAEFLAEVDAAVRDGTFPDRRAAFVGYADYALARLAFASWGPQSPNDGVGAEKLADLLLAYALNADEQAGNTAVTDARRAHRLSRPLLHGMD